MFSFMELWKKLFLLCFGCIFLMIGWILFSLFQTPQKAIQFTTIDNLSHPFSISFFALVPHESISGLDLKIESTIKGNATLVLSNQESSFTKSFILTGDSSILQYSGDWYSNSFKLKYIPEDSTTGTLSVIYSF